MRVRGRAHEAIIGVLEAANVARLVVDRGHQEPKRVATLSDGALRVTGSREHRTNEVAVERDPAVAVRLLVPSAAHSIAALMAEVRPAC